MTKNVRQSLVLSLPGRTLIINRSVYHHKVLASEVLVKRGKREHQGEEEYV